MMALIVSTNASACSSCDCTLNSNWTSQGISTDEGTPYDIRFDYFKQSDHRSGPCSTSRKEITASGGGVQDTSINRNLTLGLDHSFNQDWAIMCNSQYLAVHTAHTVALTPILTNLILHLQKALAIYV